MILIFDHGTSSVRSCLLNEQGDFIAKASARLRFTYPQPGWVEQDPMQLWSLTLETAEQVLKDAKLTWQDVRSIGITNQRETTILWDSDSGQPLYPAIVWQCRRTEDICSQLQGLEDEVRKRTGLVVDPYFSGTKIRWILDQVKPAGKVLFGTVDTWIAWKLSKGGVHLTDHTNASRTMLYNIHKKCWDPFLLDALNIDASLLPEVRGSAEINAETAADLTGGRAVPITAIAGDQQAALYGQRCWEPGQAKGTYGTGTFLMMNLGQKAVTSSKGLLSTLACDAAGGPSYALEGSIFVAGAAIDWLQSGLELASSPQELDALAASVSDTRGVYCVPAFVGLGAPHWEPHARGVICGLTQGTTRAHIIRATFEALAYQTREVLDLMQEESGIRLPTLRVDGGVTKSALLLQLLADTLDMPVERLDDAELTAKGVGYLAGLASGFWKNPQEITALPQKIQSFEPKQNSQERAARYSGWQEAVARCRMT